MPKSITVTLETVTPLFLGGAEARKDPPELRSPAFRGAMHYWLRATLGGVIGDTNIKDLHKLETEVFGSPESGSPTAIQLSGAPRYSLHSILPHKPNSGRREAFNSVEKFKLTLQTRSGADNLIFGNACMALNLAILFGGVGLRSRRGFGSLRVIESTNINLIPLTPDSMENEKWAKRIKTITKSAIAWANKLAEKFSVTITGLPASPTNYPCAAKGGIVRIVELVENSPDKVLDRLMRAIPQQNYLGGISPRQSSPLWVRVFWADEKYHLLMCVLPTKLARNAHNYEKLKELLDSKFPGNDLRIPGWNV